MKIFSRQYFDELLITADRSYRLRAHTNLHHSHEDPCQKLFNAVKTDSYIRPHRHSLDPKEECLLAVVGLFALITFYDEGKIDLITLFGSEKHSQKGSIALGLELPASVWHTVVSLTDGSILFEVKSGPYNPNTAKEMAPWAPKEDSDEALSYLSGLKSQALKLLK